jgi:hypothetical protein
MLCKKNIYSSLQFGRYYGFLVVLIICIYPLINNSAKKYFIINVDEPNKT